MQSRKWSDDLDGNRGCPNARHALHDHCLAQTRELCENDNQDRFFLREIVRGSDNMLNMLKKLKLSIVDKGNVHI